MNISNNFGTFGFFAVLIALVTTVFWMIVGWRAMLAHERLADAAERLADRPPLQPNSPN